VIISRAQTDFFRNLIQPCREYRKELRARETLSQPANQLCGGKRSSIDSPMVGTQSRQPLLPISGGLVILTRIAANIPHLHLLLTLLATGD